MLKNTWSTGPRTAEVLQRLKQAHTIHGHFTQEAIAERRSRAAARREALEARERQNQKAGK